MTSFSASFNGPYGSSPLRGPFGPGLLRRFDVFGLRPPEAAAGAVARQRRVALFDGSEGIVPSSNELEPKSNGLQPKSDGPKRLRSKS